MLQSSRLSPYLNCVFVDNIFIFVWLLVYLILSLCHNIEILFASRSEAKVDFSKAGAVAVGQQYEYEWRRCVHECE